ncbi:leucyl aminopeptidase family protein [Halovulum sp. GXIMD14793]
MAATFSKQPGATPIHVIDADKSAEQMATLPSQALNWAEANGFSGKAGQVLLVPGTDGTPTQVLAGFGDQTTRQRGRFHLGALANVLPAGHYRIATEQSRELAEETALGWLMTQYRFDRYKNQPEAAAHLVAPDTVDAARLETIAAGVALTCDLINTPTSDMGPDGLEAAVRELAAKFDADVTTTLGDDLLSANLPMIHAVGRASDQVPRLLDLRWGDPAAPAITLVGKGVCFDTGGLNIKPGASMGLMKKDMGGAATVLGLAHMIMALALPIRLRVLVPAVENSISAGAFRPGDILTSRKGLTVEVNNTDAEGRLVLADALTLADEETPRMILCMATLTGAARVALGPDLPPVFTDDDALAADILSAADTARDPLWRMPFWDPYDSMIEPGIADLDNAPKGGMAGAITAALFLRRFVTETPAFAHIDCYGWTPSAKPGHPAGGACQGARALLTMLEERFA